MRAAEGAIPPPSPWLGMLEPLRAMAEFSLLPASAAVLATAPRGDGHAVLVLPGFLGTDDSTWVLRRYLKQLGHRAEPWALGRNVGAGRNGELGPLLRERLEGIYAAGGRRKVSLVGWSLGGVQARALARHRPDMVRNVITLGSPFGGARATLHPFGERASERTGSSSSSAADRPPIDGVPCTAIFSRSDGVVPWSRAIERTSGSSESIEVFGSHLGLGVNPSVLYAIADRLAQPESEWRRFDLGGWRRMVYGPG